MLGGFVVPLQIQQIFRCASLVELEARRILFVLLTTLTNLQAKIYLQL